MLGEVDASGNLDATRTYDVYGLARSVTGTPTSKHGWVGQLGHTSEDETGLVYMRARYMDPVVGRFISEDPGMDGGNWYAYAEANPITQIDGSGKMTQKQIDWWVTTLQAGGITLLGIAVTLFATGIALFYSGGAWKPGAQAFKSARRGAIASLITGAVLAVAGVLCLELSWYMNGMTPDDVESEAPMINAYASSICEAESVVEDV